MSERRGGIACTPPCVNLCLSLPFQWIAESGFLAAENQQGETSRDAQGDRAGFGNQNRRV